jgi:allophanate hydrolase
VFAKSVAAAEAAVAVMADPNFGDSVQSGRTTSPKFAVFGELALSELSAAYRVAYETAIGAVQADGAAIAEINSAPFLAAGALLYDGAFIAERYAAVGEFIETRQAEVDPVVADIILGGRSITAAQYLQDVQRLQHLKQAAAAELGDCDALIVPTAPFQPTIAEVQADPVDLNRRLGAYSTFCNLLDLCAIAIPAGRTAAGGHFGITLYARHGEDALICALARRLTGEPETTPAGTTRAADAIELLVLGAHLRGQPLNGQLTGRGATFVCDAATAPEYRLYALNTSPPKPGLVHDPDTCTTDATAAGIAGELWAIPPHGLATLLAQLPSPMALGSVTLADGRTVVGFLCEPAALGGAEEITAFGGWRAYLER